MTCKKIKNKLQDYLDSDLSLKQRKEIANHLKTCTICQAEYQVFHQLRDLARKEVVPVPEATDRYWSATWQKIAARIATPSQGIGFLERIWEVIQPQFSFARIAYTAAIFCIGLLFGAYIFRSATALLPEQIFQVKTVPQVQEKVVVQYQEVPKLIEKPKYRVRYVVLEPAKETISSPKPATESTTTVIAVSTPETESPDVLARNQILQVQQELQKQFDEHDVSKQIAQILGNT